MALSILDIVVIVLFLAVLIYVSISYKDKASEGVENFFLGGRKLPWWIAGVSMVATTFAADTPLAVTSLVADKGISSNWLWWNLLAGGLLTTFFFARLWRRAGVVTDVQLIEMRYSGRAAKALRVFKAVYLGIFMNCLIMGTVNVALHSLLINFFAISYTQAYLITGIAMVLVMLMSSLSGLLGVAITDAIQFVVAMIGCILLAIFVVNDEQVGGIVALKSKLPEGTLDFFPKVTDGKSAANALSITFGSFLAYLSFWFSSWYPGAEPGGGGYIAQRIMSTKDESHAIKATLFFQIAHYALRPWPWIIVALCSIVLYPELSGDDKKFGYILAMRDFLPSGLRGLLLVSFLAAYMSTISTQLNWGASYLVNDIYQRFSDRQDQKTLIKISRLATLLLMIIAMLVTPFITRIETVWAFIMECGAGLGLVLILRWYWWRINAWSEIVATVTPFIVYGICWYQEIKFPNSFFITFGATTVVWVIATYLTPPTQERILQEFYRKVTPGGLWQPIRNSLNMPKPDAQLGALALSWVASIVMVYGILFGMGYLILQEWTKALYTSIAIILSFLMLRVVSKKIKLFD